MLGDLAPVRPKKKWGFRGKLTLTPLGLYRAHWPEAGFDRSEL